MKRSTKLHCLTISAVWLFVLYSGCDSVEKPVDGSQLADSISIVTELHKLYDLNSLPKYEEDAKSYQMSSYDRTGNNDDGFSGTYSYIKRNADSSLVIFDVKGAGVIHRIWTPTPSEDTLDFYMDTKDEVSFSVKFSDLFSGKQYPFVAPICGNEIGGFYCYFPIPFRKSCKIVSRGKQVQFYQIQYKLVGDAMKVKSFALELDDDEKEVLESVRHVWDQPLHNLSNHYDTDTILFRQGFIDIEPGKSGKLLGLKQGGRILGIEIESPGIFEGMDKQLDLKISWDKEEKPAVYLPVHDFFGFAFGSTSMQSLILGAQKDKIYCYYPMPFDESADISLVYRKNDSHQFDVHIKYKIAYSENPRDRDKEGKFYAEWKGNHHPETGMPHFFLNRKGKGHYVGTILQNQGLKSGMTLFFEGDDSTVVDGEMIIHGTGSEDYFNGGWYAFIDRWDTKMSLALHGSLDYSLPYCRTGGYRLYLTDKIPFTNEIIHSMEHGPVGNKFPVEYTSVALYYCDSPAGQKQVPGNETTKVYVPDTLAVYPQLMSYDIWEEAGFESGWYYNTGGMSFIYSLTNNSILRISLDDILQGKYKLFFDLANFEEGCEFSVWQRQTPLSSWIHTGNPTRERLEALYVCDIDLTEFKETISLHFRTEGKQKKLFLNRLILVREEG